MSAWPVQDAAHRALPAAVIADEVDVLVVQAPRTRDLSAPLTELLLAARTAVLLWPPDRCADGTVVTPPGAQTTVIEVEEGVEGLSKSVRPSVRPTPRVSMDGLEFGGGMRGGAVGAAVQHALPPLRTLARSSVSVIDHAAAYNATAAAGVRVLPRSLSTSNTRGAGGQAAPTEDDTPHFAGAGAGQGKLGREGRGGASGVSLPPLGSGRMQRDGMGGESAVGQEGPASSRASSSGGQGGQQQAGPSAHSSQGGSCEEGMENSGKVPGEPARLPPLGCGAPGARLRTAAAAATVVAFGRSIMRPSAAVPVASGLDRQPSAGSSSSGDQPNSRSSSTTPGAAGPLRDTEVVVQGGVVAGQNELRKLPRSQGRLSLTDMRTRDVLAAAQETGEAHAAVVLSVSSHGATDKQREAGNSGTGARRGGTLPALRLPRAPHAVQVVS